MKNLIKWLTFIKVVEGRHFYVGHGVSDGLDQSSQVDRSAHVCADWVAVVINTDAVLFGGVPELRQFYVLRNARQIDKGEGGRILKGTFDRPAVVIHVTHDAVGSQTIIAFAYRERD